MFVALIVLLLWIVVTAMFIVLGVCVTSPILFIIGILLLFVPLFVGDYRNSQTPRGKAQNHKAREKQKKIEKEFGLIEYWEDKDK